MTQTFEKSCFALFNIILIILECIKLIGFIHVGNIYKDAQKANKTNQTDTIKTVFSEESYVPQLYFILGANLRDEVRHTQALQSVGVS